MFKKMKNKIRSKLITWLEIDKLKEDLHTTNRKCITNDSNLDKYTSLTNGAIEVIENDINKINNNIHNIETEIDTELKELDNKYDSLHRTIQATVSMGADIRTNYNRTGSWAVVCFNRGNVPIVKFIDLNIEGYDGRHVYEFLKQFDAGNYKIDSPMGYFHPDMMFNWE